MLKLIKSLAAIAALCACSSEAAAQTQYYYQTQHQQQWRSRALSADYASVRILGGGSMLPGIEGNDFARGTVSVFVGPVLNFAGTYDVIFALVPEAGYSLFVNEQGDSRYGYGHMGSLGARIGFVVEESYIDEIFGLDIVARFLLGAVEGRFTLAVHAGLTLAFINHLLLFEVAYQYFTRFEDSSPHAIVLMGGVDVPRFVMSLLDE